MPTATDTVADDTHAYLPDFCAAGTILVVLLVAELVSIVLTLAEHTTAGTFLIELAKMSLYVLWLAFLSCAVLCRARGWMEASGKTRAFILCFIVIEVLCLLLAEVAFQVTARFGESVVIDDPHAVFLLRNFAISSIVVALAMRYLYVASEWRRSIVLEAQARISALQALIRPHFLFNSMNTIASLVRSAPERAEQAVEDLSDLLRANLRDSGNRTPLKDEFELASIYSRIEKLRLGERLRVRWDIGGMPMRALIPSLTIQPLLENAIYHGIEQMPEGGEVVVAGRRLGDRLRIDISNPRPRGQSRTDGHRMALGNVRQRFALAWPGNADVQIDEGEDHYRIRLEFPLEERDA